MRVYEKVREYMAANSFNEAEVAKKVGIPADAFHAMLSGKRTMYADDLRAICHALNVSPETFVEFRSA